LSEKASEGRLLMPKGSKITVTKEKKRRKRKREKEGREEKKQWLHS